MEQCKLDFSPPFPEVSFRSRKKVSTEHLVQIKDHEFILENLLDILYWNEETGEPFIREEERELLVELGVIDNYGNWVRERANKFFDYLQDLFHDSGIENDDTEYYLEE